MNYISPVNGAEKVLEKSDPAVAKNPLIFPTPKMLGNTHFMATKALLNRQVPEAVPEADRRVMLSRSCTAASWAIPYLLLAPGMAWLLVFFVVPMWYLAKMSLSAGAVSVLQLRAGRGATSTTRSRRTAVQFVRSVEYAGIATVIALVVSLPARVLHRLPRRALEEPLPAARDRAVLRHLPDPDARLGDDPLRQRLRRPDAAAPAHPRLGRTTARDVGRP